MRGCGQLYGPFGRLSMWLWVCSGKESSPVYGSLHCSVLECLGLAKLLAPGVHGREPLHLWPRWGNLPVELFEIISGAPTFKHRQAHPYKFVNTVKSNISSICVKCKLTIIFFWVYWIKLLFHETFFLGNWPFIVKLYWYQPSSNELMINCILTLIGWSLNRINRFILCLINWKWKHFVK